MVPHAPRRYSSSRCRPALPPMIPCRFGPAASWIAVIMMLANSVSSFTKRQLLMSLTSSATKRAGIGVPPGPL